MPPWKFAFSDQEVYQVILYEQSFSTPADYNTKWAPQYSDAFARNLMGGPVTNGLGVNPVSAIITFAAILLWNKKFEQTKRLSERMQTLSKVFRSNMGRNKA